MIRCFIVDDEAHAIEVLQRYIEKTPGLVLMGFEENPLTALDEISSGKVTTEIAFLDVDMPQLSGVALAELLPRYTSVVFTTAHPDYAFQAFEKDAIDYLLKPITYERFLKSVNKIKESLQVKRSLPAKQEDLDYFYVKSELKGKMVKITFDEITYIEALQNYVKIHIGNTTQVTYLTMKEVEEYLPSYKFSRVHKSFIVNHDKVKAVEGNQLILQDESIVSLGANYRETFLQKVHARLLKSRRLP